MKYLDIHFRQITTFIKVYVVFVFWLQTLLLLDFTKIFQLKEGSEARKTKAIRTSMNVVI